MELDTILKTAMKMISLAGDGRCQIQNALNYLLDNKSNEAEMELKKAFELIKEAHIIQTKVIQEEMAKENIESVNLLFAHAQDTLMTINSEYNVALQLLVIYQTLSKRISRLEEKCFENR